MPLSARRLRHDSLGAFGYLLPLIPMLALLNEALWKNNTSQDLRSLSSTGHIAVALVILSGAANALFIVGWRLGSPK